ncbi:acyltransferase ChoActase/COT/CPT [Pluteus cervinus]|uniref:Acyltransferase ChoActase/COT/CPT n=1 Tax=Pluteus cervinus TaxID=181527 RepID=A0ACD3AX41_9AGAR|nr:acyltransferase ChoActase/COT/CPT [Pluteus cervinus]
MRSTSSKPSRPFGRPRLPVPDLRKTLDRYLASLEPLLLEDEVRNGTPFEAAYTLRHKWADEFERGIGRVCQERLKALDSASPHNWLDDNFWTKKAYLEWRAPLLINSNWWLAFHDDNLIPEADGPSQNYAGITKWQRRRAAWLLHRMLEFKDRVDIQELHPDTTRTGIWLRDSVSQMFNLGRIPKHQCDILSEPVRSSTASRKVYIVVHDYFYSITVYSPPAPGSTSPQLLNVVDIEQQIRAVVRDVEKRLSNGERATPIGVLSSDDRDRWAANLTHLLSLSPKNQEIHQIILESLMGLSLDHATHVIPSSPSSVPRIRSSQPSQSTLDSHLHAIRSTSTNVSNRFFDKPLTLIVDPSAQAGAMGEHSPCDALVPSIVAEYGVIQGVDLNQFEEAAALEGEFTAEDVPGWERLDWVVDNYIRQECVKAHESARKAIDNSDDSVLWFEGYGSDWIKATTKLSPDAYIQMVLQLAWYKARGEFTATYETALTRMFHKGRTETLRTLTKDSRRWVLSMLDPSCPPEKQYANLKQAVQTHTSLTREAATGKGIDRHLLGLRLMLQPEKNETTPLFNDPLFNTSSEWKLSTSGLSAGHLFRGTGFGAAYEDGYGINYLAAPDMIKFGIESKFSNPLTSTDGFMAAVVDALHQTASICHSENVQLSTLASHL